MDSRWCLYLYVVVNSAFCVAKPVSLNEVIAAESQKQLVHAASPKLEELAAQRFTLNKGLKPLLRAASKFKETGSFIPFGEKLSALKYRKTFQIKSPLRPKRLKHTLRRHNHKNQSVKREISGNEKLNQKYIPLLRSLSMLFDNLLEDSSESTELRSRRKQIRYYTDTSEILCPCSSKSNAGTDSEKTAITSAETLSDEAPPPEASSETPDPTPPSHFRRFRQNKNIPLLLPRNTNSGRRDDNRLREGGRAAHHGSAEGNIPWNHGDSEHGPGDGSHGSDATDDEEDPGGHSRDDVSSFRPWRRIRDGETSYVPRKRAETDDERDAILESTQSESTLERSRGNLDKLKREDKQQIRRDEAESANLLPASVGRLRGFLPEDKVDFPESKLEKSESHSEQTDSSDQRLADGDGTITEENKKTSTGHETVNLNNIPTVQPASFKTKNPVLFIIDGYSVTRNKNGENKLKEKKIHIHSK